MKRKPQEKLSDRFERLWLTHVKKYDTRYFPDPTGMRDIANWTPLQFAVCMKKYCMEMIAEYEPEDIE